MKWYHFLVLLTFALTVDAGKTLDESGVVFELLVSVTFDAESKAHSMAVEVEYLVINLFELFIGRHIGIRPRTKFDQLDG